MFSLLIPFMVLLEGLTGAQRGAQPGLLGISQGWIQLCFLLPHCPEHAADQPSKCSEAWMPPPAPGPSPASQDDRQGDSSSFLVWGAQSHLCDVGMGTRREGLAAAAWGRLLLLPQVPGAVQGGG